MSSISMGKTSRELSQSAREKIKGGGCPALAHRPIAEPNGRSARGEASVTSSNRFRSERLGSKSPRAADPYRTSERRLSPSACSLVDRACDLSQALGLPVRNTLAGLPREEFLGPGSIVRVAVDSTHHLGYGMPATAAAYFRKSRAFDLSTPGARIVVRYAERDLLMSGWMVGEPHLAGNAAVLELPVGRGRVILLGFSPYFRAQPHGTFKLLFNALY